LSIIDNIQNSIENHQKISKINLQLIFLTKPTRKRCCDQP
jgi:hypothetical protein